MQHDTSKIDAAPAACLSNNLDCAQCLGEHTPLISDDHRILHGHPFAVFAWRPPSLATLCLRANVHSPPMPIPSKPDESPPALPGKRKRYVALSLAVFVLVLAADLVSKSWAWNNLKGGRAVEVIPHVLYLKFGFNPGASFSFLNDVGWARGFFILIAFTALAWGMWLLKHLPTDRRHPFVLIGLFAGGVAGNLHDRFVRTMRMPLDGEMMERYGVVDFIQVYYDWSSRSYWPIFNVADSAMVCTALLMFYFLFLQHRAESRALANLPSA